MAIPKRYEEKMIKICIQELTHRTSQQGTYVRTQNTGTLERWAGESKTEFKKVTIPCRNCLIRLTLQSTTVKALALLIKLLAEYNYLAEL